VFQVLPLLIIQELTLQVVAVEVQEVLQVIILMIATFFLKLVAVAVLAVAQGKVVTEKTVTYFLLEVQVEY
tara:strand:+ start:120 stop:332 length:213 start_codon:yes stop_codon:yes gene_type:complete